MSRNTKLNLAPPTTKCLQLANSSPINFVITKPWKMFTSSKRYEIFSPEKHLRHFLREYTFLRNHFECIIMFSYSLVFIRIYRKIPQSFFSLFLSIIYRRWIRRRWKKIMISKTSGYFYTNCTENIIRVFSILSKLIEFLKAVLKWNFLMRNEYYENFYCFRYKPLENNKMFWIFFTHNVTILSTTNI